MILGKLLRHRGLGINLLAGFCFLMLAVYGWGLTWKEMGGYLLVLIIFLGTLISIAALLGWCLHKLRKRNEKQTSLTGDNEPKE